jgi:uncharacterized membrane protein
MPKRDELQATLNEVTASGRTRAVAFALGGAALMVAGVSVFVVKADSSARMIPITGLVLPGVMLFVAGTFTAAFGRRATERRGLGWSLLRIAFGILSILFLVVGSFLLIALVRRY